MEAFLKTGKLSSASTAAGDKAASSGSHGTSRRVAPTPWVEKFRPRTLGDVAYQDEVVAVLKRVVVDGADLPNLLFYGPPGTGKTSTILAAARDFFGPDLFRQRILELNASDERGISVIREKVKTFAQTTPTGGGKRPDGKPIPPFKIIILDEADSMTRDAQSALRRTMEKEGRTTRFCLICNYISRIIEPLTSRCAKFRFKPLARDVLIERLQFIAGTEKIEVSNEAMEALLETSEGDLRKAITSLQSCAKFKDGEEITNDDVFEMSGVVPDKWMRRLFEVCKQNSFDKLQNFVDELICEGFSVAQLILQLHAAVVSDSHSALSDLQKSTVCEALAVAENCLLDGASEYLQLLDVCAILMKVMS